MKHVITIGMISLATALTAACGDSGDSDSDSDSGDSGDGDSGDGDSGDGDSGDGDGDGAAEADPCDPSDTGDNDCPEYVTCAENNCQPAYETCLGANYLTGDFSGGTCQAYMECVTGCQTGDTCDSTCAEACDLSSECLSCMIDEIGGCVTDMCSSELQECSGGAMTGDGDLGAIEGGCTDLEACCNSMSGDEQSNCLSQLDAVAAGGDAACGATLTIFTASGTCS